MAQSERACISLQLITWSNFKPLKMIISCIAENHDVCVSDIVRLRVDGDTFSLMRLVLEVIAAGDTLRLEYH